MYNTENQLKEHGSKIPQSVKDQVQQDITGVNEAITSEDPEKIREAVERLKNSGMEIGKAIYSQSSDSGSTEDSQQQ